MSIYGELPSLDLRRLVAALLAEPPSVEPPPRGYHLGVVQLLSRALAEECTTLRPGEWPECAEAFAHALRAAEESGDFPHRESVIRRLNMTALLLRAVPPSAEVDLLNPRRALDLLFHELPLPLEQARESAPRWRTLERPEILRLRIAKNMLKPLLEFRKVSPGGLPDPRLDAWEAVFPLLP